MSYFYVNFQFIQYDHGVKKCLEEIKTWEQEEEEVELRREELDGLNIKYQIKK